MPKGAFGLAAVVLSLLIPDIRGLLDPTIYPFQGERLDRMAAYLWLTSEGTYGTIAAIMSQFIFIFILFAGLLESTGAGQVFIRLAFALTGLTPARRDPKRLVLTPDARAQRELAQLP